MTSYAIGAPHSVEIEWQYGLTALTEMIGLSLPRDFRPEVIKHHADWSLRFNTGRVLQAAWRSDLNGDLGKRPFYVRPARSLLESGWTKNHGTIRQESIGHPTILNQHGQVVQSEVYVDRLILYVLANCDQSCQGAELIDDSIAHHVSESTEVELTPWSFTVNRDTRGNTAALHFGKEMYEAGYRPATLTEVLWYTAKYQDEIQEGQVIVPWAGYSGGFSEGRQMGHHLGLPFVVRHKGVLTIMIKEFLGQWMPVGRGVEYLAVKN